MLNGLCTKMRFMMISAAMLVAVAPPAIAGPVALGTKLPGADLALKNAADGKAMTLAKATGTKGTLVVFTCNDCPFANAWEDRIVELGNGYAKQGIGVVFVNANNPGGNKGEGLAATAKRAKSRHMQFPYALDESSNVARAFGAERTPEAFLFDKDQKLVYSGTIDDNSDEPKKVTKQYLKDALQAVVNGKAPPVAETKSLGCGIKFKKAS